jgi:hypothetical protein
MMRTQIQLPDEVYERARAVCRQREISLAELARRGLEYILSVYAAPSATGSAWQPPTPRRLGWRGLSDAEVKEQAQLTTAEAAFLHRRKP